MNKKSSRALLAVSLVILAGSALAIEPTVGDVYKELQKGNIPAAKILATEVLKTQPDSAEAHYAMSKVMIDYDKKSSANALGEKFFHAKDRPYFEAAKKEFETAKLLQPKLPFVSVSDVAELQAQIESRQVYEVKEPGIKEFLIDGLSFVAMILTTFGFFCHVFRHSSR